MTKWGHYTKWWIKGKWFAQVDLHRFICANFLGLTKVALATLPKWAQNWWKALIICAISPCSVSCQMEFICSPKQASNSFYHFTKISLTSMGSTLYHSYSWPPSTSSNFPLAISQWLRGETPPFTSLDNKFAPSLKLPAHQRVGAHCCRPKPAWPPTWREREAEREREESTVQRRKMGFSPPSSLLPREAKLTGARGGLGGVVVESWAYRD